MDLWEVLTPHPHPPIPPYVHDPIPNMCMILPLLVYALYIIACLVLLFIVPLQAWIVTRVL